MPGTTRAAIMEAFMEQLETTPIDSITVRSISHAIGMSRNTFYYYFDDVYDLLDAILRDEIQRLTESDGHFFDLNEAIEPVCDFLVAHRKAVRNIYNSDLRDRIDRYIGDGLDIVMKKYVSQTAEGLDVPQADIDLVASFLRCACVGQLNAWMASGEKELPVGDIKRVSRVISANLRTGLISAQEDDPETKD